MSNFLVMISVVTQRDLDLAIQLPVEVVMISQESTTKDVKLFGYDFRGHTRGTLVVEIANGYLCYKGSAIFSPVFLCTTNEKSFIPYKASAAVQAL